MNKFDVAHMEVAQVYANLSHCTRRKVGALLVSPDNRPLLSGYNGTSPGRPNCCEGEDGLTLQFVHHAEANLVCNAAKKGISTENCTIYVTTSPCIDCAKLIEASGITKVIFRDSYKSDTGVDYLNSVGIEVIKL